MKKKIVIAVIAVLVISNIYFLSGWQSAKSDRLYYDYAIPHIELVSAMAFYGVDVLNGQIITSQNSGDIAVGKIAGFIVFPNPTDQPKDARQYYTIEATDTYDENRKQVFMLLETLKLNAIPPRAYDKELLSVTANNEQFVTLENEDHQSFRINKRTHEVVITDADGGTTSLITNQSDFRDFIVKLLK